MYAPIAGENSIDDEDSTSRRINAYGIGLLFAGIALLGAFWSAYWFPLAAGVGCIIVGALQLRRADDSAVLPCLHSTQSTEYCLRMQWLNVANGCIALTSGLLSLIAAIREGHRDFFVFIFCAVSLAASIMAFVLCVLGFLRFRYMVDTSCEDIAQTAATNAVAPPVIYGAAINTDDVPPPPRKMMSSA